MIIEPKIRGFICATAHPLGCDQAVREQIDYVSEQKKLKGVKHVLVIGASTGYGLASRIVASFSANAKTIGVFYERQADEKRTASPGWYNAAAFERYAHQAGHYAKSLNGDAFSDEMKKEVAALIKNDFKTVDLIIYSVAAPKRLDPETGTLYSSTLKPIGEAFEGKTVDAFKGEVKNVVISPANEAEIEGTVAVMGGDDWARWIDYLMQENLLAEGFKTVAYSYVGPHLTHAIYKEGTIGRAKDHLKKTADELTQKLQSINGEAIISVDKAVVTQASAAIPVVPLYIAILFKVMKEQGTHEGCIEQMYRLFANYLYTDKPMPRDPEGMIRLDDLEMSHSIQEKVASLWPQITTENVADLTDIDGYREEFYRLFGFGFDKVDYTADVNPDVPIESVKV